jgi:RNA polymerase sigma-B factor
MDTNLEVVVVPVADVDRAKAREKAPGRRRAASFCRAAAVPAATMHRVYAESHDPELEAELMRQHEPLALQLAASFSGRGESLEDLGQVARVALLVALRRYDPARGAQFSSYAVPTIVGALKRHFRDRGWLVRPPRRVQEAYLAVNKTVEDLAAELGRSPTVAEIAARAGLSAADVAESLEARGHRHAVPVDAANRHYGDGAFESAVSDHGTDVARADDRLLVAELVRLLPRAERAVVTLTFLSGLTQVEIAAQLGTSQATVSRLRRRALDQLRLLHGGDATAA